MTFWPKVGLAVVGAWCAASGAAGQDSVRAMMAAQVRPAAISDQFGPSAEEVEPTQFDELTEGEDIAQAAWLQQPGMPPSLATNQPTVRRAATASRLASTSLASVPNMFGDCGMTTANVTIVNRQGQITAAEFMLPMVGGARTAKIAENDIAMPVDRIFLGYNHYTDIFQMQTQQAFPPVRAGIVSPGADRPLYDGRGEDVFQCLDFDRAADAVYGLV